jgi:hypothetical protein
MGIVLLVGKSAHGSAGSCEGFASTDEAAAPDSRDSDCPAKLPYAGITRIRFEGSVSTAMDRRYPRFEVH